MTDTVDQLRAMRRNHGDTPLGNRFLNVAKKLKARAECHDDPARAAAIERSMRRDLADIASLQGR